MLNPNDAFYASLKPFDERGKPVKFAEFRSRAIAKITELRRANGDSFAAICTDLDMSRTGVQYHLRKQELFLKEDA